MSVTQETERFRDQILFHEAVRRSQLSPYAQFLIGTRIERNGLHYVVTKSGPQRLDGNRKQRRAKEAELRKAGAV